MTRVLDLDDLEGLRVSWDRDHRVWPDADLLLSDWLVTILNV